MATKIQIKRSSEAARSPTSSDLDVGELAINVSDKILYSKDSGGNIFTVASGPQSYTLPKATATSLGGIKVGSNLTIDSATGVLSATDTDTTYTGSGLISIDGNNVISTTANNYSHPSGDGNLHVPSTGTTNAGKVLTAGATPGSLFWTTPASTYTLPTASSSALGGIKVGYVENDKNYPVQLLSGKAFVNVPWTGGMNYVSSTTAPSSPVNGDHWFDSAEGILYTRIDSNWVDVTTASAASGGGGGAMEFISKSTVTSPVASVEILTDFSLYDKFVVVASELKGSSNAFIHINFKIGGSYKTDASYDYTQQYLDVSGTNNAHYNTNNAVGGEVGLMGSSTANSCFTLNLLGFKNGHNKAYDCHSYQDIGSSSVFSRFVGIYDGDTGVVQGLKFSPDSGNFTTGKFTLYGIKDS